MRLHRTLDLSRSRSALAAEAPPSRREVTHARMLHRTYRTRKKRRAGAATLEPGY